MIGRLLFGIIKGIIVGGLVGFALAKMGFVAPGAVIAYIGAAVTGVLIGLVAGKPIWAKDAKIEAGMKAVVGALLGAGLMWAARRWLGGVPIPFSLGALAEPSRSLHETGSFGTVGGLALTSLPVVAGLLGAFYEVDNTPAASTDEKKSEPAKADAGKAAPKLSAPDMKKLLEEIDEEDDAPAEKRQRR